MPTLERVLCPSVDSVFEQVQVKVAIQSLNWSWQREPSLHQPLLMLLMQTSQIVRGDTILLLGNKRKWKYREYLNITFLPLLWILSDRMAGSLLM